MKQPLSQAGRQCWLAARGLFRTAAGFVYPPCCPLCGQEDDVATAAVLGPELCVACRSELAPPVENSCLRCGAPVGPHLDAANGCVHCRQDRFAFERVVCLGVYDGPLRAACLRLKQPGSEPLAAALAGLLGERVRAALGPVSIDRIVSVPEHWSRSLWRVHNPAVTLAEALTRRLKVPRSGSILAKVRRTPAQAGLMPSQRRTNLRGAFEVWGGSTLSGRTVLLVDDILTTGTTAQEASKALKRGGAERIFVAVLARGLGASRGVSGEHVAGQRFEGTSRVRPDF